MKVEIPLLGGGQVTLTGYDAERFHNMTEGEKNAFIYGLQMGLDAKRGCRE